MKRVSKDDNAGLIRELVRFLLGFVLVSALWFTVGWAISNPALGLVFCVWSAFIGPLVIGPGLWWMTRARGKLLKPDLSRNPDLCDLYFRSLLEQPGPAPEIWLWEGDFSGFLVFENFSLRSKQSLLLTQAWLAQPFEVKEKQWEFLWNRLAKQSRPQRLLRRVELHVWIGAMSLLELFCSVLKLMFEILGLRDLPPASFWMQMSARRLHLAWFGPRKDFLMSPRKNARGELTLFPRILNSLLLGPWFAFAWKDFHPLYLLITPTEVDLDGPARPI